MLNRIKLTLAGGLVKQREGIRAPYSLVPPSPWWCSTAPHASGQRTTVLPLGHSSSFGYRATKPATKLFNLEHHAHQPLKTVDPAGQLLITGLTTTYLRMRRSRIVRGKGIYQYPSTKPGVRVPPGAPLVSSFTFRDLWH